MVDKCCVILIVAALAFSSVAALAKLPEQMSGLRADAFKVVEYCGAKYNIDVETVENALENDTVQDLNPCFLGCIFENGGLIDGRGYPTPDKTSAMFQSYISDPELFKIVMAVYNKCSDKVSASSPKDACKSGSILASCIVEDYIKWTSSY